MSFIEFIPYICVHTQTCRLLNMLNESSDTTDTAQIAMLVTNSLIRDHDSRHPIYQQRLL